MHVSLMRSWAASHFFEPVSIYVDVGFGLFPQDLQEEECFIDWGGKKIKPKVPTSVCT